MMGSKFCGTSLSKILFENLLLLNRVFLNERLQLNCFLSSGPHHFGNLSLSYPCVTGQEEMPTSKIILHSSLLKWQGRKSKSTILDIEAKHSNV
jgi:hypothetical protein